VGRCIVLYIKRNLTVTSRNFSNRLSRAAMLPQSGILGDAPWRSWVTPPPIQVELKDDFLHWTLSPGRPPSYLSPDTRGMLGAFIRLRDDEGILRFAQRYGVLFICEHGVPASHNSGGGAYLGKDTSCKPQGWPDDPREPVACWLRYARLADAFLEIGYALHSGQLGDTIHWETIYQNLPDPNKTFAVDSSGMALFALSSAVQVWLSLDPPTVRFRWLPGEREPELQLKSSTFGALGLQLAAALLRVGSIVLCHSCGAVYEPRRKPRAGYDKRNFCPDCRDTVGPRLRQRDRRASRPL